MRGEEIPLAGRIVAVADVFDALTNNRPYKPAMPLDQALAEIRLLRGRQFDPEIVDAFDLLDHGELLQAVPSGSATPLSAAAAGI